MSTNSVLESASANTIDETDLAPTLTAGYKVGEKKSMLDYAKLDQDDEPLTKWKESLGIRLGSDQPCEGPRVVVLSLSLVSESRSTPLVLDTTQPDQLLLLKKSPVTIKEGAEYSVELKFKVQGDVVTGLRYIQVVKRAGIKVDKLEKDWIVRTITRRYSERFAAEEAPSGMLARSGSYNVRSRVIDDDGNVYVDFEWGFKLGKEW